jgi:hypothetical protein
MLTYTAFDTFVVVTGVASAVHQGLITSGCGEVNRFCPVVPGDVAWDDCDCGQLTQTINTVTPAETFTGAGTGVDTRVTPCGPKFVIIGVTLSVVRCVPVMTANNHPPTCDSLYAAAYCLERDRSAARTAIACFLRHMRETYQVVDFSVGVATSVGPQGACVGFELPYRFSVGNVCCG